MPDEETKMKIESLLVYRRKTGRGRCLKASFPPLGLKQGWRLEPSSSLPDVGDFAMQRCPFSCVFYTGERMGEFCMCRRSCRSQEFRWTLGVWTSCTRGTSGQCPRTSHSACGFSSRLSSTDRRFRIWRRRRPTGLLCFVFVPNCGRTTNVSANLTKTAAGKERDPRFGRS